MSDYGTRDSLRLAEDDCRPDRLMLPNIACQPVPVGSGRRPRRRQATLSPAGCRTTDAQGSSLPLKVGPRAQYSCGMCGRYITPDQAALEREWATLRRDVDYFPSYNFAPTLRSPVAIERDAERKVVLMTWGFQPHWAKRSWINAQAARRRPRRPICRPLHH